MSKMRAILEVLKSQNCEASLIKLIGIKEISDHAVKCLLNQDISEYKPYLKVLQSFASDDFKENLTTF